MRCTRELTAAGVPVVEVKRPVRPDTRTANRPARRRTDRPLGPGDDRDDHPEGKTGVFEMIRTLRVTPAIAVRARMEAFNKV